MSGSEPRLMPGRGGEPYGMALQNSSSSPSSVGGGAAAAISNMCLAFSSDETAVYKPIMPNSPSYHQLTIVPCSVADSCSIDAPPPPVEAQPSVDVNDTNNSAEPIKRKRGRPRKYPLEGSPGLAGTPQPQRSISSSGSGFPMAAAQPGKKGRGRPPGSGRKQLAAATALGYGFVGPASAGFTPHIITVKTGEDITSRIQSLIQNGGRAVCILSASGAISNVTLRQSATSGGSVTYEGRFDIISLSGSFMLLESDGQRSRTGGLSVSLAGPDGRVLGGCVAGVLIAASPIQMVVGSFIAEGHKETSNSENQSEPFFVAPAELVGGGAGGTLSEVSGGHGSPIDRHGQGVETSNMAAALSWK